MAQQILSSTSLSPNRLDDRQEVRRRTRGRANVIVAGRAGQPTAETATLRVPAPDEPDLK